MIGALFFLVYHSTVNRLVMRVRRLKQPKYLIGAIVGVLWIYSYFFRFMFAGWPNHNRAGQPPVSFLTPENLPLLQGAGALLLGVIVVLAWVLPHQRAAVTFSEAEVAFLFPAPIDRKTLIHFKLLRSQIGILVTTVIFTLLFRRGFAGNPAWTRAIGWWLIFSILNLHFLGASFARTMLLEHGISTWKRRVVILSLVGVAAVLVAVWVARTVPAPDVNQFHGVADLTYYGEQALQAGPLPYLLFPFELVVRPYLSIGLPSFFMALWPALLLLVFHYVWVVRSNVAFEEASVEASRKLAERIATLRANRGRMVAHPTKKKRPPFKLGPAGPPAIAFLWKNLIGAGSAFTLRFWLICLWLAVVSGFATTAGTRSLNLPLAIGTLSGTFLMVSFFLGPQLVRQDFRTDLQMADVLKMYPLTGRQVALGELLAPAAILTAVQWLLIVLCAVLSTKFGRNDLAPGLRLAVASGLAVLAPALDVITLLIPNAAVLLFPGWFHSGKDAPQGIEMTGQRLIMALGQLVVLVFALVPAAAIAFVMFLLSRLALGPGLGLYIPIPLAAISAALILCVEGWLGLMWLGRMFDRLDLSLESGG